MFGGLAVRECVLNAFPDAGIAVFIVWIPMLQTDDEAAAGRAARMFADPRVRQFYDADRDAGRAFASAVLNPDSGPAWDVYFFYNRGAEWSGQPPRPVEWMHQLGGGERADASRFRSGQRLIAALHEAMVRLGQKPATTRLPSRDDLVREYQRLHDNESGESAASRPACAKCEHVAARSLCAATGQRVLTARTSEEEIAGRVGRSVRLRVDGMQCPGCIMAVAAAVLRVGGVLETTVDFDARTAIVRFDQAAYASTDALIDALRAVGFSAKAATGEPFSRE